MQRASPRSPTRLAPALLALAACGCSSVARERHAFALDAHAPGFEVPRDAAIVFFVDGVATDVLADMLARGELPGLQRTFVAGGVRVRHAVACVPSVTFANAAALATGALPAHHGVWANTWFDRYDLFTRSYEAERDAVDGDLRAPTVFERLHGRLTGVVGAAVQRGAKLRVAVSAGTGGTGVGIAAALGLHEAAVDEMTEAVFQLGELARELGRWPALLFVYFHAVDAAGHEHGPSSAEYRAALAAVDRDVGALLGAFEEAGLGERLTLVFTSDHGHHDTPRSFALEEHLAARLGVPVLLADEDDEGRDYVARFRRYSPARVVVTVAGARQASVHLRAGDDWSERPGLAEVLAFPRAPADAEPEPALPSVLLESPAVELVVVRAGPGVRLYARRGSAAIERVGGSAGSDAPLRYRVLSGADPLGYDEDPRTAALLDGHPRSSRAWLAATAEHAHPDAVPQLAAALESARAGDALVFAAPGWDFSPELAGGHGGLLAEEMLVPLFLAGPRVPRGAELECARLVDVVPTLSSWPAPPVTGSSTGGASSERGSRAPWSPPPRAARPDPIQGEPSSRAGRPSEASGVSTLVLVVLLAAAFALQLWLDARSIRGLAALRGWTLPRIAWRPGSLLRSRWERVYRVRYRTADGRAEQRLCRLTSVFAGPEGVLVDPPAPADAGAPRPLSRVRTIAVSAAAGWVGGTALGIGACFVLYPGSNIAPAYGVILGAPLGVCAGVVIGFVRASERR